MRLGNPVLPLMPVSVATYYPLQLKLALMEGPDFPIALGVIRDVEAPTYNDAVAEQIDEVKAKKKYHNFQELLMTNETWEVK